MKRMLNLCMVVVSMVFYAATVWGSTEGGSNNFFGTGAGASTSGFGDTFMGANAGFSNTTGGANTFMGFEAGVLNTTGYYNTFMGDNAGGLNTTGYGNVFLGYAAGYSETGSNKLYIDNCFTGGSCTSPLIYGEFDTRIVAINGSLGIGTTAPTSPLSIVSSSSGSLLALETTSTTGGAGFQFKVPAGGTWFFKGTQDNGFKIRDAANNRDVMYFQTATGNVGIGTITPSHLLHLAGGAYSDGMTWNTASSRELKNNIKELSAAEAVAAVKELNPVTYTYKVDAGEQHVGFIAEDVPALVATKNRKGLSAMDIVAVLTKTVQEQQKEMKEKDARIERLEKAIEMMEQRMVALESPAKTVALK